MRLASLVVVGSAAAVTLSAFVEADAPHLRAIDHDSQDVSQDDDSGDNRREERERHAREYDERDDFDCVVSAWGAYEPCDEYTNTQTRHRTIEFKPKGKGKACPILKQTITCQPVHCKVSHWSDWTSCDANHKKSRYREVLQEPQYGGTECPALTQEVHCQPVDCDVCDWSDWVCDKESGITTRTRRIQKHPEDGGKPCPHLVETASCMQAVDCEVSDWSDWHGCLKDVGLNYRTRSVTQHPKFGGRACPLLTDKAECIVDCEPEDEWNAWGECDEETGKKVKRRGVKVTHKNGGKPCRDQDLEEVDYCEKQDCEVSESYGEWSECDAHGRKYRSKKILKHGKFGGKKCPREEELVEMGECIKEDCEVSDYGEWSDCDGNGKRFRKRNILKHPKHGGKHCPADDELIEYEDCADEDCEVSDYDEWTECDKNGKKSRSRNILKPAKFNGKKCPAEEDLVEYGECPKEDCEVSDFGDWSECDHKGKKSRIKKVLKHGKYGGKQCPADEDLVEYGECPKEDCEVSDYGEWSECDHKGKKSRSKKIVKKPKYGGEECPAEEDLVEYGECPKEDCEVSGFGDWTDCDADGKKSRSKKIVKKPKYGGEECPVDDDLIEYGECPKEDCEISDFGDWTECDADGKKSRSKRIVKKPKYGGKKCPVDDELVEYGECPPEDCELAPYDSWSECDVNGNKKCLSTTIRKLPKYGGQQCPAPEELLQFEECAPEDCLVEYEDWTSCDNDGKKSRKLNIVKQAGHGGKPCPSDDQLTEYGECPKEDCEVSSYGEWSECDVNGKKSRSRKILKKNKYGGQECPSDDQLIEYDVCPQEDCELSSFTEWSECDKNGRKSRSRKIVKQSKYGGKECPAEDAMVEYDECPKEDCELSSYSDWTECDSKGKKSRSRMILKEPKYGGKECPKDDELVEYGTCPAEDCVISDYGSWSECDNKGDRFRTKSILKHPKYGGKSCPQDKDLVQYGTCPSVDCVVSEWGPWSECVNKKHSRSRTILTEPKYGGSSCPKLEETDKCD